MKLQTAGFLKKHTTDALKFFSFLTAFTAKLILLILFIPYSLIVSLFTLSPLYFFEYSKRELTQLFNRYSLVDVGFDCLFRITHLPCAEGPYEAIPENPYAAFNFPIWMFHVNPRLLYTRINTQKTKRLPSEQELSFNWCQVSFGAEPILEFKGLKPSSFLRTQAINVLKFLSYCLATTLKTLLAPFMIADYLSNSLRPKDALSILAHIFSRYTFVDAFIDELFGIAHLPVSESDSKGILFLYDGGAVAALPGTEIYTRRLASNKQLEPNWRQRFFGAEPELRKQVDQCP